MQTEVKDLNHYMGIAYPVRLTHRLDEDDPYWFAEIPDLPGCMADGATPDEAIADLEHAKALWIENHIADGYDIPEPVDPQGYSGKLSLRIPKSLHRRLADQAKREGVSLNQHIMNVLASQAGAMGQVHGIREVTDRILSSRLNPESHMAMWGRHAAPPIWPGIPPFPFGMGLVDNAGNILLSPGSNIVVVDLGPHTGAAMVTDDIRLDVNNVIMGGRGRTIEVGAE